jgi:tetraprenyl-beta-curcumene synthase
MAATGPSRLAVAHAFAGSAARYWLAVFPQVVRELRHWRRRALQIPDPVLRRLALATQRAERGNIEGAAAFAVLAPRAHRAGVVRAAVAFQTTYDYVDTLVEQPGTEPFANGRQLHLALLSAVEPGGRHRDYYRHHPRGEDNGYVRSLVDACRQAFASLPSYAAVAGTAARAARRMIGYQSLNHGAPGENHASLSAWATALTPAGAGLHWWETAAATASSLTMFALIAAAASPLLDRAEALAVESAYFPWIGALHVLLDSLVDRAIDTEAGHHSLVDHYDSVEEAAGRLGAIAERALQATSTVSQGTQHAMILAGMASFYLSAPCASGPDAGLVSRRVRESIGPLATPTLAVLRARRAADSLLSGPARPRATP